MLKRSLEQWSLAVKHNEKLSLQMFYNSGSSNILSGLLRAVTVDVDTIKPSSSSQCRR